MMLRHGHAVQLLVIRRHKQQQSSKLLHILGSKTEFSWWNHQCLCLHHSPTSAAIRWLTVQGDCSSSSIHASNTTTIHSTSSGYSFFSSAAGSLVSEETATSLQDVKRYLSPDSVPSGSLSVSQLCDLLTSIDQLALQGSPQHLILAFDLMDRVFHEMKVWDSSHDAVITNNNNNNNSNGATTPAIVVPAIGATMTKPTSPITMWSHQIHRGDYTILPRRLTFAWMQRWKQRSINDISPQRVLDMLLQWERYATPSQLDHSNNRRYLPYKDIVQAILHNNNNTREELEWANEVVIQHVIREGSKHPAAAAKNIQVACHLLMKAWAAKIHEPEAPVHAETMLHQLMNVRDHSPWLQVTPTLTCYHLAMTAWMTNQCRITQNLAPYHIDEIYRDMKAHGLIPYDQDTLNNILTAWTRCSNDDEAAPEQALVWLQEMRSLFQTGVAHAKTHPDQLATVLSAFVQRGNVVRADQILTEHVRQYRVTRDDMYYSNAACFKIVMQGWIKRSRQHNQHRRHALESAETVLRGMQHEAHVWNDPSLVPDVEMFNSLLQAWVESDLNGHAVRCCKRLFQRMQSLHKKGHAEAQPNELSYRLVLKSWELAPNKAHADRAEALLRLIKDDELVIHAYNSVMKIWSFSRQRDAADRTQALFDEVLEKYNGTRNEGDGNGNRWKPTLSSYTSPLRAWSQSLSKDNAEKAEAIFDALMLAYQAGDEALKPDNSVYTTMIDVWASARQPKKAEAVLRQMEHNESDGVKADVVAYNGVMNAWCQSQARGAAEKAQSLFDELVQKYKQGDRTLKPDTACYNTLISGWGRSGDAAGALKAQALFDEMPQIPLGPDVATYNALIDAWAKAGMPDKAEETLRNMETNGLKPDLASYNSVMTAFARSSCQAQACERAQALFDEMKSHRALKPDGVSYLAVLTAWAGSNSLDGASKAQAAFDEMVASYKSGDKERNPESSHYKALIDVWFNADQPERIEQILHEMDSNPSARHERQQKPILYGFNLAMKAWVKSNSPGAGVRVQALFDKMMDKYKAGDKRFKPILNSFNMLIKAWGRCNSLDGAKKAQAVFDELVARSNAGEVALKPDVYTCAFLLHAWATAGEAEKAEQILRDRTYWLNPKIISYHKVMQAWSRLETSEGAARAQALFDDIQQMYNNGDENYKPDLYTFGFLMSAYGRTNCRDGALKAQVVFDDLLHRHNQGDQDLRPQDVHYNSLVDAWGRAGDAQKAEQLLREIEAINPFGVKPDVITYGAVIGAWCRTSSSSSSSDDGKQDGMDQAQSLYEEMKQKFYFDEVGLKPEANLYESLLSAWCESSRPDAICKAEGILEDLTTWRNDGKEYQDLIEKFTEIVQAKKNNLPDISLSH